MNKRAQQEMVGFVLIVTIVIVALIVFLVINLNQNNKEVPQSEMANNILSAVLGTTTTCSLNYIGNNQTIAEMLSEMYSSGYSRCESGILLENSLNSSLNSIFEVLRSSDGVINFYDLTVYSMNDELVQLEYEYLAGNCSGSVYSSEPLIVLSSEEMYYTANLMICIDN